MRQIHLLSTLIILLALCCISPALAGGYLNSAHGDTSIGVNRSSTSLEGYTRGNCAHCHEQHATDLTGGPYNYSLFYDNYVSLGPPDGLCFKCHDGSTSTQTNSISNYSYSYRAGNWTAGSTPNNISDFFDSGQVASYHDLDDISTFIQTQAWGYTADSNPCVACHNPHAAQGDPENSASAKSSGTRGWPLSRPGRHTDTPWDLWGDDYVGLGAVSNGEKERMRNYTANYQAPYRFGSQPSAGYEPDGSTITDGSNLTDFITFCTDCHDNSNTISSTPLIRNLLTIDWSNEKHGQGNADTSVCLDKPYDPTGTTFPFPPLNHVLSCMDCHESHGSPNAYLVRDEVNGTVIGTTKLVTSNSIGVWTGGSSGSGAGTTTWQYLCNRCHKDDYDINSTLCTTSNTWFIVHHQNTGCNGDPPYAPGAGSGCGTCHTAPLAGAGPFDCTAAVNQINCDNCHFHGSIDNIITLYPAPATGLILF